MLKIIMNLLPDILNIFLILYNVVCLSLGPIFGSRHHDVGYRYLYDD